MTDLDRLPFDYHDSPATPTGAKGAKCRRHDWEDGACRRCHALLDPSVSRRGKNARNRGNAFEREVAEKLGGRRVGQYGDKVDVVVDGYLQLQCKNGAAYPERLDGWLRSIPVRSELLRGAVIGDAPGSGTKRRAIIVFDLDEYRDWHGKP
jgi:hypothetical protein